MDSHLNCFIPCESARAWHENQHPSIASGIALLPAGALVVADLVAPEHRLQNLSTASFETQRARLLSAAADVPNAEAMTGISVLLAPDASSDFQVLSWPKADIAETC